MLRIDYHETLEKTRGDLVQLGALTLDALRCALASLRTADTAMAGRIVADDQLERLRRRIDASCLELLWRQQPLGGELRAITAMHEISLDLGIVQGHVNEIAKQAFRASGDVRPESSEMHRLGATTESVLRDALTAFERRDAELVRVVYAREEEIDDLYTPTVETIQERMKEDPEAVATGVSLLFVLIALQRIAERAQNIAWHTEEML